MKTITFVPFSDFKSIQLGVLESFRGEIIEVNCTFPRNISHVQRIIMVENAFKESALKESCDFYVYNQADIKHITGFENIDLMQNFLIKHLDFGAVALCRQKFSDEFPLVYDPILGSHICSGCVMFTRRGLEAVCFDLDNGYRSTCYSIGKSLSDAGLKYGYLDNKKRVEHLGGK